MLYVLLLLRCRRPAWINWRTGWDYDENYNDASLLISDDFINPVPSILELRSHFPNAKTSPLQWRQEMNSNSWITAVDHPQQMCWWMLFHIVCLLARFISLTSSVCLLLRKTFADNIWRAKTKKERHLNPAARAIQHHLWRVSRLTSKMDETCGGMSGISHPTPYLTTEFSVWSSTHRETEQLAPPKN
jgi:hypothetical protein